MKAQAVIRGWQTRRRLASIRQRIWLAGLRVPAAHRLRALFYWLDDSKDGSIDSREWIRAATKFRKPRASDPGGLARSSQLLGHRGDRDRGKRTHVDLASHMRVFNDIDVDKSASIEEHEFVEYFLHCSRPSSLNWMRDSCATMLRPKL